MCEKSEESLIDHLICPISLEIMKEPVLAEDGITYEKSAIQLWFKKNSTSPMNGIKLESKALKENLTLKNLIEFYNKINSSDKGKNRHSKDNNIDLSVKNNFPLALNNNIIGNNNQLNFFLNGSKNVNSELAYKQEKSSIADLFNAESKANNFNLKLNKDVNNKNNEHNNDTRNQSVKGTLNTNFNCNINSDTQIFETFIFDEDFNNYKKLKLRGKILEAFGFLEKSYASKFIFAIFHMFFYLKGVFGKNEIIEKNEKKEKEACECLSGDLEYLELLASEGNSDAAYILSVCYFEGFMMYSKNRQKAIELLKQPSSAGCTFSLNFLGFLLQDENRAEAQKAWEQAYAFGCLGAKYNLIYFLNEENEKLLAQELRNLADTEEYYLACYETGEFFAAKIKFNEERTSEEELDFIAALGEFRQKENTGSDSNTAIISIADNDFNKLLVNKSVLKMQSNCKTNNNNFNKEKNQVSLYLNNHTNFINAVFYYQKAAEQGHKVSIAKLSKLHLESVVNSGFRSFISGVFHLHKANAKLDLLQYLRLFKNSAELRQLYLPSLESKETSSSKATKNPNKKVFFEVSSGDNAGKNQSNLSTTKNDSSSLSDLSENARVKKFESLLNGLRENLNSNSVESQNESGSEHSDNSIFNKENKVKINLGKKSNAENNALVQEFEDYLVKNSSSNQLLKSMLLKRKRKIGNQNE